VRHEDERSRIVRLLRKVSDADQWPPRGTECQDELTPGEKTLLHAVRRETARRLAKSFRLGYDYTYRKYTTDESAAVRILNSRLVDPRWGIS
jgi:hypothetical protein